jgi:hypothetical protein
MTIYQDIRSISPDLSAEELLRHLIVERFPGKTVVTASLKAPSVVVLKMVADIGRATPVVFCRRGFQFPESRAYRERIVALLGLENISERRSTTCRARPTSSGGSTWNAASFASIPCCAGAGTRCGPSCASRACRSIPGRSGAGSSRRRKASPCRRPITSRSYLTFVESVPARSPSRPPTEVYAWGGREGERAGSVKIENGLTAGWLAQAF